MKLNQTQIDKFHHDGFLVVENVLEDEDLSPLEKEYLALFQKIAKDNFAHGNTATDLSSLPFDEGYTRLVAEAPGCVDRFNISLPLVNGEIDPHQYTAHTGPAVFGILTNPKLLDLVESIIGPEIASSPVQQMRLKPPQKKIGEANVAHSNVGITTWHQDTVSVLPEAYDTNQVTVWVGVTDADENNGCLVSIPGSHKEGPHQHVPGRIPREPTVPANIINDRKGTPLPVRRGGIIIFNKQNIHCALPNRSNHLRWSVDIRYHPVGQPSGRPAFPGFVARSRANPSSELKDPAEWATLWSQSRMKIINGEYKGKIFSDWE